MKIRKLRGLWMAIIAVIGGWSSVSAYTTDELTSAGWTKVESLSDTNGKVFVLVDANSSNYAMSNATNADKPIYQTFADPIENPSQTWLLEGSGDTYAIKNAHSKFYYNSGDAGWNCYLDQNKNNAEYKFAFANGKYSLTSVRTNQLVGPWNNDGRVANDGEGIAANKGNNQAPGFYIYSMSLTDYAAKRTALVADASKVNPINVSGYIYNPNFASNNHFGWHQTGSYGNRQYGQGTMEAWNINNADISQELTGLPNGVYKVTVDIISGPGVPMNAYLYAIASNEVKSGSVTAVSSAGNYGTMSNEVAGKTLTVENVNVVNGSMKIGVKDPSTGNGWIVLDNFTLTYYGVDLSALQEGLDAKIAEAQDINQSLLNDALKNMLNTAISDAQNAEQTEDGLTEQTNNLTNTINAINNCIDAIGKANALIEECENTSTYSIPADDEDRTNFNTAIESAKSAIDAATDVETINTTLATLESARQTYVTSGAEPTDDYTFDLTFLVVNPGFDSNLNGWISEGGATNKAWANNKTNGIITDGFFENWNGNNFTGSIYQEITGLPNGTYIIKAAAFGNGTYLFAEENQTQVTTNDGAWYTVEANIKDGILRFGIKNESTTNWMGIDNVSLSYKEGLTLEETLAAYEAAVANAETTAGKTADAEAALKNTLTDAVSLYGDVNRTDKAQMRKATNILNTAVNEVNASITAYASAKAYLDKMGAVLDNTNVYTQEAYDAKYGTWLAEYNAGTLATATAATLNADVAYNIGWHSASNIDDILLSSWTIGGKQANNFDQALYTNTWSVEGNTDGSEFLAPFLEYWTDDNNSLTPNNIVSTLTGLKPSTTYSFTIRARVRQRNGGTKIENGITMKVGEGQSVDISSGAQFNGGVFYIGNFSAIGQTDAEGKLTTTITVAEGSGISWLSFYNAKYTEGEDLSAYIADYEFALANANTALSKGMNPNLRANLQNTVNTYSTVDNTDKAALIAAKEALEAAVAIVTSSIAELEGSSITGWSKTGGSSDIHINTWSAEGNTDGSNMTNPFIEYWQGKENGAIADATITYTLTDQVPGYYKVSALIRSLNESGGATPLGTFIFANTAIERAYTGTNCTNGVFDTPEVYGYVSEDGILAIGVKVIRGNVNWVSFKNFKVEYVGTTLTADMANNLTEEAPTFNHNTEAQNTLDAATNALSTLNSANYVAAGTAIETAYKTNDTNLLSLNNAIDAAETAMNGIVLGFGVGEYAPYTNAEFINALNKAKDIDQATINDQSVIDDAVNALNNASLTANITEMNAIYDGSFEYAYSTDGNVQPTGWHANGDRDNATNVRYMWDVSSNAGLSATSTSKALFTKYEAYYGQEEGYTMPLKANTIYELTFVYGGWNDCKRDGYVTITDPNGANIEITVSRLPLDATNGHQDASVWKNYKARFQTSDAGNYVLGLRTDNDVTTVQSQYVYGDMKLFAAKAENINFTFKADYGTLILPFEAEIPAGMEAYTCTETEDNGITMKLEQATALEANTPYVLKKVGATNDFTFSGIAFSFATSYEVGLLTGTLVDTTAPVGSLVLQNQPAGLGFYEVESNNITVNAHRAYVTEEAAGANVRALILPGIESDIENVSAEDAIVDVYTIGGIKVKENVKAAEALNGLQKGIYIVNGKKVVK